MQNQQIPDFDGGLATTDSYVSLRAGGGDVDLHQRGVAYQHNTTGRKSGRRLPKHLP